MKSRKIFYENISTADLLLIGLDESSDHTQRSQAEILEGPSLAHLKTKISLTFEQNYFVSQTHRVEEGVEIQWDVSQEKCGPVDLNVRDSVIRIYNDLICINV